MSRAARRVQLAKHLKLALHRRRRHGRQRPLCTAVRIAPEQLVEGRRRRVRLRAGLHCVSGPHCCNVGLSQPTLAGKMYANMGLPELCAAVHLHVLGLLGWRLTGLHGSHGCATCAQYLLLGWHVLRDCYMSRTDAKFDAQWPADANVTHRRQESERKLSAALVFATVQALSTPTQSRPLWGMLGLLCPSSQVWTAARGCGRAIPFQGLSYVRHLCSRLRGPLAVKPVQRSAVLCASALLVHPVVQRRMPAVSATCRLGSCAPTVLPGESRLEWFARGCRTSATSLRRCQRRPGVPKRVRCALRRQACSSASKRRWLS